MKVKNVDVYIFIKGLSVSQESEAVCRHLCENKGVVKAELNRYVPSLLNLEYDAGSTSGLNILTSIRQQGYQASLVGM